MSKVIHDSHYSLSDYASDPTERKLNFRGAKNVCADKSSRLVVIKNKHTFSALQKKIGKRTYNKYWIGASFINGAWTWNDGEVLNYTNWMTGKPGSNTTNKCIAMKYEGWEEFDCDKAKFHFVCESAAPHTLKISKERPYAKTGENLIFSCSASGFPVPEVKWSFNDTEIAEQTGTLERVYQTCVNGSSTLFIQNASLDDGGIYRCKASNNINGKTRSAMGFADLMVVREEEVNPKAIKRWKLEEEDKEHKREKERHHLCRRAIPKLAPPQVVTIHQEVTPTWAIPVVVVLSIIAFILILAIVTLTCKSIQRQT